MSRIQITYANGKSVDLTPAQIELLADAVAIVDPDSDEGHEIRNELLSLIDPLTMPSYEGPDDADM